MALPARLPHPLAVELERQGDVLGGGQRRDQVEVLEDEARPGGGAAWRGASPLSVPMLSPSMRTCPLVGRVEAAGEVEQGRLARPARAHHRDQLAGAGPPGSPRPGRARRCSPVPWTRVTLSRRMMTSVLGAAHRACPPECGCCWCRCVCRGGRRPLPVGCRRLARAGGSPRGPAGPRRGRASGPRPRRRRSRFSRTSSQARSTLPSPPSPPLAGRARCLSRVRSCRWRSVAVRWVWTTRCTSTPWTVTARASLMTSSSRGVVVAVDGGEPPLRDLGAAGAGEAVGDAALGILARPPRRGRRARAGPGSCRPARR